MRAGSVLVVFRMIMPSSLGAKEEANEKNVEYK